MMSALPVGLSTKARAGLRIAPSELAGSKLPEA